MGNKISKTKRELLSLDLQTKIQILVTFTYLGSLTLLLFCGVNILRGSQLTGILDGTVAILLLSNLIILKKWQKFSLAADVVLALLFSLYLFLFFEGGFQNTGILWLYTFPLISFFLCGKRGGIFWSSAFILAVITSFLLAKFLMIELPHDDQFLIIFIISLSLESAVTFSYEAILSTRQDMLFDKADKLDQLNENLRYISDHDSLTQCFNRRKIIDQIKMEAPRSFRYNSQCSVMLFDLDHFKEINDNYGHLFGDYVLKEIISLLKENVLRAVDSIGRYGGEEFLVVLPSTNLAGAKLVAERIRASVKMKNFYHVEKDCFVPVTVSVGVTMIYGQESVDTILLRADKALYKAKHNGRDRVEIFDPNNASLDNEKNRQGSIYRIPRNPTVL